MHASGRRVVGSLWITGRLKNDATRVVRTRRLPVAAWHEG